MAVNYTVTLTDDQDANPIDLLCTSFQTTWRNFDVATQQGDSYLELVVPGLEQASEIDQRIDGTIRVYRNGAELFAAALESIRYDSGPSSQSISIRSRTQWTNAAPVTRTPSSGFLTSTDDGRSTWRGPADGATMPGDTVDVDLVSFEVETLTYISSVDSDEMILTSIPPSV